MPISTAVDQTRVSRVVGYKVYPANFEQITPYLPQRIAVFGEANTANQATLDTDPYEFISAKEVADKYGYGSPLHQIARILRPLSGNPLGGIPTVCYPQASDGGATEAVYTLGIAVSTSVTANATHKIYINGRDGVDGQSYDFSVTVGQSAADVQDAIVAAVNSVINTPVVAAEATADVSLTTKWGGATAILNVRMDTQGEDAGIVYSEVTNVDGTGAISLTDALALFEDTWNTIVINPYGSTTHSALETFNGVPDPTTPTGRYEPTTFKPLVAYYGLLNTDNLGEDDKDDIITITNASARKDQVTNVLCPAPLSEAFPWEAAANVAVISAPIMQNFPHNDCSGKPYPDMPVPSDEVIGDMSDYDARDFLAKRGSSTVNLKAGKYTMQDLITTYAPDGDVAPKFRFVRDLNVDWNVGYNSILIMENSIQDKAIIPDNTPSSVINVIKPKTVKGLYIEMFKDLERLAMLADSSFSKESIVVGINETNPARLDIFFRYKRTSTAHIVSNDAAVDFNYST